MWKHHDFRCLKPKENIESEKWPHYEMTGYRAATNEQELRQVKEIEFDKYFFNLEDPEVFKAMTDTKKGPEIWRKTYGFDYLAIVEGKKGYGNNTKCFKDCFKAEQSKFAKKCKKDKGLFKCCMLR